MLGPSGLRGRAVAIRSQKLGGEVHEMGGGEPRSQRMGYQLARLISLKATMSLLGG